MPDSARVPVAVEAGIVRLTLPIPFGPRQVNCYLLDDGAGFTLIDTGVDTAEADAALGKHLAVLGIARAQVRRVILTHYHADHSGQAFRFRNRPEVEVALHPADLPLLDNFREDRDGRLAPLLGLLESLGMPPEAREEAAAGVRWLRGLAQPAPVSRALHGGERIEAGGRRWEVVPTPGHTPGHLCLLDAGGVLLGGDLLMDGELPYVGLFPDGDPDPVATLLQSLERLRATEARRCLPGHGRPIEDLPGRLARTARALDAEYERAAAFLGPEPESPWALLQRWAPGRVSPFQRHAELLALSARLEHLAAQGRAERLVEKGAILYRTRQER